MKKLIVIIVAIAFPILMQAQTKGEKIHAKYSKLDGFNSFSFAGSFLKNLDFNVDEDELEKNITGDCKNIKFLTFKHVTGDETKFKKLVSSQLSKGEAYKEVLTDSKNKNSEDVHFFAKGNGKKISEFHVLHYNENRTSLVSFFGDFHVDELKTLSHFTFDDEDEEQED
ncbi:hypothetical protein BZG02_12015 [Labilibaculum filiforme]|uniref:DUF4252 domain-containing protein n=1 Tax=Labilibaculum filiforme TaxID=1940526 RepID=A0A2N3HWK2_9BACT|nr:DUF4252 domain-containing protein [Labilibaculum filiforme]PKQ62450.1 hypothetical protein BZG02_12015 [Labilibaculum filiforme]